MINVRAYVKYYLFRENVTSGKYTNFSLHFLIQHAYHIYFSTDSESERIDRVCHVVWSTAVVGIYRIYPAVIYWLTQFEEFICYILRLWLTSFEQFFDLYCAVFYWLIAFWGIYPIILNFSINWLQFEEIMVYILPSSAYWLRLKNLSSISYSFLFTAFS
jgi:hypothetical protein